MVGLVAATVIAMFFCTSAGLVALYFVKTSGSPGQPIAKGPGAPAGETDKVASSKQPVENQNKKEKTADVGDPGESPAKKGPTGGEKTEVPGGAESTVTKNPDGTVRLNLPDKEITERVRRAGGKIGKVTVSLAWQNYNDLDLHVVTASGEKIFYGNRRSLCGGQLDIDQNVTPTTTSPIENIFWSAESPPRGPFKIYVHHYRNHGLPECRDPTPFVVRVQIDDNIQVFNGSVSFVGQPLAFVAEIPIPSAGPKGK
jgi:hypothetical protein